MPSLPIKVSALYLPNTQLEYRLIAEVDSDQYNFVAQNTNNGIVKVSVQIQNLFLRYGKYSIHLHVTNNDNKEKILRQSDIASFVVTHTLTVGADFLLPSKWESNDKVSQ